ncbi:Mariner Mos1 transposase [Formica fusca]
MSSFEPNKRYLRELLIYFFNLKKSAAEAYRLLVEAYGEAALSERSCREWFQKFKNLTSKTKNVAEGRKCMKTRNWKHYWIKIRAKRKKNLHLHWE